MVNIYWVRHGQVDWNVQERLQGRMDACSLNETGRRQRADLVQMVRAREMQGDMVISTPLRRGRETVEPLAAHFDVPVLVDDRLAEMDFGACEGMLTREIKRLRFTPPLTYDDPRGGAYVVETGQQLRDWHKSTDPKYDLLKHPGGETKVDVRTRVADAVFECLEHNPKVKNLWIGSHSAVMRNIMAHYASPEVAAGGVRNGEIAHFRYDSARPRQMQWVRRLHATAALAPVTGLQAAALVNMKIT